MPTVHQILRQLEQISNEGVLVAVVWHVVIGGALAALLLGWRPSKRLAGALLSLPLFSVSATAWTYGNPFNGWIFLVAGGVLLAVGLSLGADPVRRSPTRWLVAGLALLAFGWVYPAFLESQPRYVYLMGAPVGLIPCPTLAVVCGLALMGRGLGSRPWAFVLAAVGLSYGLIGAFVLGVAIDLTLLVGAVALATMMLWPGTERRRSRPVSSRKRTSPKVRSPHDRPP